MLAKLNSGIYIESQVVDIPAQLIFKNGDQLHLRDNIYTVELRLGQGGFGSVYKIRNASQKVFAIKILDLWRLKPNEFDEVSERFKQGFLAGQIDSDYLVHNLQEGKIQGNPYIIMEFCPNGNLNDRKSEFYQEYKFSRLAISVLKGLQDLHQNGVIHRDIKPDNILFDIQDNPKLTDFDIVGNINKRMTAANWLGAVKDIWGTAVYAPPEQLNHKKAFAYTKPSMDVFAFGVTMYEVLSGGKYPFGPFEEFEKNPVEYYEKIKNNKFSSLTHFRPDLNPFWVEIIHKCIQSNPKDRFQNPGEILQLLKFKQVNLDKNKLESIELKTDTQENFQTNSHWNLKIINGEGLGAAFSLDELEYQHRSKVLRIGWDDQKSKSPNHIRLKETYTQFISGQHATLEKYNGKWFIRDGQWNQKQGWKASTNGTLVNGLEVSIHDGVGLKNGDILTIGEINLKIMNI
ncbi:MAG: protein kinase [Saprospiraceae bacterium]|jgi:serine/threonine protein kinase|nr:protein kinase [Saprospiraceae bacterium]MBX7162767.1 protein kinase [Saprospiraceae bacterium]